MPSVRTNPSFMNGVPELIVLRLLSEKSMYGYEIARAIQDATDSAMSMGEGVLYPVLHTLERNACLASRKLTVEGRNRIYYRITPKGRRRLQSSVADWTRIVHAVTRILGTPSHG